MTIADHLRKRGAAAAVIAGGIAVAGALASTGLPLTASAAPAPASGAAAAAPDAGSSTTAGNLRAPGSVVGSEATPVTWKITLKLSLTPMPLGQLAVRAGRLRLTEYGLTPGSSHAVAISFLGLEVPVGTLTANSGGSISWRYSLPAAIAALDRAEARAGAHPPTSNPAIRVVILNAGPGTSVIALTPAITGRGKYPVHAVEPGYGVIKPGSATLVYSPATATISVTVNATGLTPGAHAAHIHAGSCQQQGPVVYPLKDFIANSYGDISNETRTLTGVKAVNLSGGWYLNLHQGNSSNILSRSGQPTIYFRPLECASI
jgi:hypothetical protein